MTTPATSSPAQSPQFLTTRWSVVALAGKVDSPAAAAALEGLCRAYWYPLYAWIRRQGRTPHDAQDLTQAFFAQLLQKGYLHAADPQKGRFRTFLLVALKRFLANEWDRTQTLKRGGGIALIPIDTAFAEERLVADGSSGREPDREYDRGWAVAILEQALAQIRGEFAASDRLTEFDLLKGCLTADRGAIAYDLLAEALGVTEGGARSAVHRIRKRFRELFRECIAVTVASADDVEEEIRFIIRALGSD